MKTLAKPVTVRFLLVQTEETAANWTDPKIIEELAKFLKIWATTVHAEAEHTYITIDKPLYQL